MKFKTPDGFPAVNGNRIIWRYMSLDKFLHLLTDNKLVLPKGRFFPDQNEFSAYLNAANSIAHRRLIEGDMPEAGKYRALCSNMESSVEHIRSNTFISCWSIRREESYALWKIYLGGSTAGVAIKTTVSKLQKSLIGIHSDAPLYAAEVGYGSPDVSSNPTHHDHILTKQKAYEYEKEFRIYYLEDSDDGKADSMSSLSTLGLDVDLDNMITEYMISPFAPDWFGETLIKTVERIQPKLKNRFVHSEINEK
jgi:hypothetical protein